MDAKERCFSLLFFKEKQVAAQGETKRLLG
jgi:hypothetical protein